MSNHQIVNFADHRHLRVHASPSARLGDNVMACLTVPAEFRQVQGHFPIVFHRDLTTGTFNALALFGFENGENLFVDGDTWDAPYRPLALAIQPFLVGRSASGDASAQVHIDMASPRISTNGDGTLLFDDAGQPTPYLETIAEKLGDLDHAYRAAPAFFAALERHELLEPFTMDVTLVDGARHSLVGYHAIDEDKLAQLDGDALAALHGEGHLQQLFMAVASMSRLGDLVARKNSQTARV
jgi:SapC